MVCNGLPRGFSILFTSTTGFTKLIKTRATTGTFDFNQTPDCIASQYKLDRFAVGTKDFSHELSYAADKHEFASCSWDHRGWHTEYISQETTLHLIRAQQFTGCSIFWGLVFMFAFQARIVNCVEQLQYAPTPYNSTDISYSPSLFFFYQQLLPDYLG